MLGEFLWFLVSDITSPALRQWKRARQFHLNTSPTTSWTSDNSQLIERVS